MTTDLFPSAVTLSPRATWQRQHDLVTREYQHPHSLNGSQRWICANRANTRYASAETEDAAEQAYCERYGMTWWKLVCWNEAMSAREECDFKKAHEKEEQIGGWKPASAEEEMSVG
jgi:hypothetical protein